ncbi:MAG: CBS domain-containing protein [Labilithrix sp.]|nr:CBS domain-containing protein [Labilithrix sp.]MCW5832823.1 CBS domain-containing protein [Labilithrix sp.]
MPRTVADIMNQKLLYIRDGDRVSLARRHIIEFGVTAVPVLDETHRPVGVVSLRDLAGDRERFEPSGKVETVQASATVEEGARRLAESEYHHLVVVDDKGVAVGMVSSLDFLRELVGLPPRHPERFERF